MREPPGTGCRAASPRHLDAMPDVLTVLNHPFWNGDVNEAHDRASTAAPARPVVRLALAGAPARMF